VHPRDLHSFPPRRSSDLAMSLVRSMTPDQLHLYAVDFGAQTLASLVNIPHCGAVIAARERDRQERLIRFLTAEVDRRRHGDGPRSEEHTSELQSLAYLVC